MLGEPLLMRRARLGGQARARLPNLSDVNSEGRANALAPASRTTASSYFSSTALFSNSAIISLRVQFSSVAIIRNLSAISRGKMEHTPMLGSCCFFVARFTDG